MTYDTNDSCEGYAWGTVYCAAYVLTPCERPGAKRNTCEASRPCGQSERPSRWRTRPCESLVGRDVRNTRTRGNGCFAPSPQLTSDRFLHTLHRTCKRGFKCI